MKNILKKYNDFIYGYLLIAIALVYWTYTDFINVQSDDTFSLLIIFLIIGFLVSKLFYLLRWFKNNSNFNLYRIIAIILLVTSVTFGNANFIKNIIIIDTAFILFGITVLFLIASWTIKYQKNMSVKGFLLIKRNWLLRLGLVVILIVVKYHIIRIWE